MKFSTKMSLTFVCLLAAALGVLGLAMTGQSFAARLSSTFASLHARQLQEKYAIEANIYSASDAYMNASDADETARYSSYIVDEAARQFAEQNAADGALAVWSGEGYSIYSDLPGKIPRAALLAVAADGAGTARLALAADGTRWLLLARTLTVPGTPLTLLSAYDVTDIFAARNAQLATWLAATIAVLALGGALARRASRRLTAPLTRLQTASEGIAAGNYHGRTGVATDDEIGRLSESFDAMAEAVESRVDALNRAVRQQKDFTAALTHELKTPMTSMLGYAGLLRAGPQDAAAQKDAADYIFHETRRLEELSGKLMTLMGLEEADGAGLDFAPVTDRALFARLARARPTRPGDPPVTFAAGGCTVRGEAALLEDLFRNLIDNAVRACRGVPGGGVRVTARAEGGWAAFTVADNGCGIPPQELPRITEPFYMVDKSRARAGGGSGMGLALCRKIAELHGTTLEFESAPGKGTTVTVALPLAESAAKGATPHRKGADEPDETQH